MPFSLKVNTKSVLREKGKKEIKHNPYVSINCIRFLGYNLSPLWAPLCLYKGKVNEKESEKKVLSSFF